MNCVLSNAEMCNDSDEIFAPATSWVTKKVRFCCEKSSKCVKTVANLQYALIFKFLVQSLVVLDVALDLWIATISFCISVSGQNFLTIPQSTSRLFGTLR